MASSEQRIHKQSLAVLPQTQQMTSGSSHAPDNPQQTANAVLPPPHEQDEIDYETLPTTSVKVQLLAGAIAGIAEHTIIYPIDAIKVLRTELPSCHCPWVCGERCLFVDENAGHETDAGGCVYGHNACRVPDSIDRGGADNVEGNDKCRAGSRC